MKNMSDHYTNSAFRDPISNRDLITETMRDKGMTFTEAFRWLYQCTPVFCDNDVIGGNHG